MRMTASWLDPAVGSTEYKDVVRDLRATAEQAPPQIVLSCFLLANATGTATPLIPTRAEPAAVLGARQGVASK
jgi:hypothetical protein